MNHEDSCCTRKKKLGNRRTARIRADRIGCLYYKCPYCKWWHLTRSGFRGLAEKVEVERCS